MRRALVVVALALGASASSEEPSRSTQLDKLLALKYLTEPAISPDARWVAYLLDDEIWRVAAKGGEPEPLVTIQKSVSHLAWSPNGRWLAYIADDSSRLSQVWGLPAQMGGPRQFSTLRAGNVHDFAWSPDSEHIVVRIVEPSESLKRAGQSRNYTGTPVTLEYKDADLRDVMLKFAEISTLNFLIDSDVSGKVTLRVTDMPWDQALDEVLRAHGLGYTLNDVTVRVGRLSTLELEPPREKTPPAPRVVRGLEYKQEGVGPITPSRTRLAVVDVPSGRERSLDIGELRPYEVEWSPDGRTIAFSAALPVNPGSNTAPDCDLYVMPADGSELPRAVVKAGGTQHQPTFSRDGKELAYRTEHDVAVGSYSAADLRVVNLASGMSRQLGPVIDRELKSPRFSADGKGLLFLLEDAGCVHVARIDLRTGRLERPLGGERTVEAFSEAPDGTLAVVEGDGQRPAEVAIVERGKPRLLAAPNRSLLDGLELGTVDRWRVRSGDGTTVDGFVVRPAKPGPKPWPGILWLHGGPDVQATASFNPDWQALAMAGYTVIAPNPRGSSGYGTAYAAAIKGAWGTHDFDDVMAALDAAVASGIVDPQRMGVGGSSYGGWLTNHIITRTTRFRGAVSGSGVSNLLVDLGVSDRQVRLEAELGLPWSNREAWVRQSPWFDAPKVKTPTLVLCGEDDIRTPLVQSELWYYALRRLGVETELVVYPEAGHGWGNRGSAKDWMKRTLEWFDRFVLADRPGEAGK